MNKLNYKTELAANVLIIVVALLLGVVIVQKYFFNILATINQPAREQPVVGSKVNFSDVDFTSQPKTLILVLQKGCHFCNESVPFYKRIIENVQIKKVKLVAVLPGSVEESTEHLSDLGLNNLEVKQASLNSLQVSGTPTLILTNDKGEVTNYWVGKLPPDKEMEVINKLKS